MHSPMEQFEIRRLLDFRIGDLDASFTNSALWMIVAVILATGLFVAGMRQRALVPGRLQSVAEMSYEFIAGMVRGFAGSCLIAAGGIAWASLFRSTRANAKARWTSRG